MVIGNSRREISLCYPAEFPYAPPCVYPRDRSERWSTHQWPTGELCLQFGPDNWEPHITGAQMVESAYLLLSTEQDDSGRRVRVAPSRHEFTLGQRARGTMFRLIQTSCLISRFSSITEGSCLSGEVRFLHATEKNWTFVIRSLRSQDGTEWTDNQVPTGFDGYGNKFPIFVVRLPEAVELASIEDAGAFRASLQPFLTGLSDPNDIYIVVILQGSSIEVRWVGEDSISDFLLVPIDNVEARLPSNFASLADAKVAIVGCGSVGSKIASSLVRSGVRKILLVDDDLLLPENLVRNDLDWLSVGSHKSAAVARRLNLINSSVDVEVSLQRLAGQESAGSFGSLLTKLSECDLVVDATADDRTFNFLSAVVARHQKPLMWAGVYAGGIGGIIARHRPGLDPAPQIMRRQIEAWWAAEDPDPAPERTIDYGIDATTGPLVAGDAEVGVIAAHASRLAIDTLLPHEASIFSASVYLIGLQAARVFRAPFDTIPITVSGPTALPTSPQEPAAIAAEIAHLLNLWKQSLANSTSPESGS